VAQVPITTGSTRYKQYIYTSKWTWTVDLTLQTYALVFDLLHAWPLSVLEFPCIADEGVYGYLKELLGDLQYAVDHNQTRFQKQEAFFALESFIFEQCLHADYLSPNYIRDDGLGFDPALIPGNFPTQAPSTYSGSGYGDWSPFGEPGDPDGGIVDTFEDPCCCKLIADLEYLGIKYKITSR
jgi:hypothetical protein